MADSVDRVFVHALNTVKKIPRTGSARPPPADRLRLYGLYKQAMEGDVDGVMDRPGGHGYRNGLDDDTIREQEKWDAWDAQKGVSRTEAKRRYIEALIETMHRYASSTTDARELVAELEFVWDQIKNNSKSTSSSNSSPPRGGRDSTRRFQRPLSGDDGPMKVLSPMSQDDEEDREREQELEDDKEEEQHKDKNKYWKKKLEATLVKMTAEMAALREQIASGREWRDRRKKNIKAWLGWGMYVLFRQVIVDAFLLGLILIWFRKKKDRRLEDIVRDYLRRARAYIRRFVPSR